MSENNRIKFSNEAVKFSKYSLKKFKKRNDDYFDSKSDLKDAYFMHLMDLFPDAIDFCVRYGYIKDDHVQEVKVGIYKKIVDPDFGKRLKKLIKHDEADDIKNLKLLPIIIREILMETKKENDKIIAADPNAKTYDMSVLAEISQLILRKKLRKMEKTGIDQNLSFDILSVIPCKKALSDYDHSRSFRIKSFYMCLYEHAKTTKVPFSDIVEIVIPEEYYPSLILFALLERKSIFTKFTDSQKELYLQISNWCFDMMEKTLSANALKEIIEMYIKARKKDESKGTDENRRYPLASISETDYKRISKTVKNIIAEDGTAEKYLN